MQNFIDLRAAVRELFCVQTKKNSDENKPLRPPVPSSYASATADSKTNIALAELCSL